MTKNYKILAKFIKDMSSETPDVETYMYVKDHISQYQLGIDINSKANHLTYLGDTKIGKNSNIGAGTITCNYDGVKKYKTKISDNVFVGSNTSLVAPIKLEKDSIIGAGSVITKNVRKKTLAITRSSQIEVKNYKRKKRK